MSEPGMSAPEERRLVTALFADLSGFTALSESVDAETLLAVVDPVIAGMVDVVGRYGGYVEKYAGDAVLALFGAPVAHEDDAARALAAALDMHAQMAHLPGVGAGLQLHIGVASGTVVARTVNAGVRVDYAVLGEAVILAQRLQSAAPASETYVAEMTRRLAGPGFGFAALPPLAVKGRSSPLAAQRLLGTRPQDWPAADQLMVGRGAEYAVLQRFVAGLGRGGGGVVRVEGAAGAGKSVLLTAAARLGRAAGARIVTLRGAPHAQAPYRCVSAVFGACLQARYPVAGSLEHRLAELTADPHPPASLALTAVLAGYPLPGLPGSGAGDEVGDTPGGAAVAGEFRRRLAEAARGWLGDLVGRGPVLLIADDLQWFDSPSADLLAELTEAPLPGLLLCAAGRPGRQLEGVAGQVLTLGPLTAADVSGLVLGLYRQSPDEELVTYLRERSSGNPMMVKAIVEQLEASGRLDARHGHVRLRSGLAIWEVPDTLESLLTARLDALTAAGQEVVGAAAVLGMTVSAGVLRAVSSLPPDAVAEAAAELMAAGILEPAGGGRGSSDAAGVPGGVQPGLGAGALQFSSPLLREVAYGRLTGRRRRAMHNRAAAAVESSGLARQDVALLAEHWFLAGEFARALPMLCAAAGQARRVFAQAVAALALHRAVEAARAAAPGEVAGLLAELGEVQAERGELDAALAVYRESCSGGGGALAWAGAAAVLRRQGRYAESLAWLDTTPPAVPGDRRLLLYERSWTLSVMGDLPGSRAASADGLQQGSTRDRVAGLLLLQLVRAETLQGDYGSARLHAGEAIDALTGAGDVPGLCTALRLLGSLQQSAGDPAAAVETLQQGLALARSAGVVEEIGGCHINLGLARADLGDHWLAEEAYRQAAVTFERAGIEAGRAMAYGNRSYELLQLGRCGEARALGLEALKLAQRAGNAVTVADIHHTLGLVAEATGDFGLALAEAEAAADGFLRAGLATEAAGSRDLAGRVAAQVPPA